MCVVGWAAGAGGVDSIIIFIVRLLISWAQILLVLTSFPGGFFLFVSLLTAVVDVLARFIVLSLSFLSWDLRI